MLFFLTVHENFMKWKNDSFGALLRKSNFGKNNQIVSHLINQIMTKIFVKEVSFY